MKMTHGVLGVSRVSRRKKSKPQPPVYETSGAVEVIDIRPTKPKTTRPEPEFFAFWSRKEQEMYNNAKKTKTSTEPEEIVTESIESDEESKDQDEEPLDKPSDKSTTKDVSKKGKKGQKKTTEAS
jgi:hypothetical protein